eukprot:1551905-Pyramimonas_sp.AAC.1
MAGKRRTAPHAVTTYDSTTTKTVPELVPLPQGAQRDARCSVWLLPTRRITQGQEAYGDALDRTTVYS